MDTEHEVSVLRHRSAEKDKLALRLLQNMRAYQRSRQMAYQKTNLWMKIMTQFQWFCGCGKAQAHVSGYQKGIKRE